MLLLIQFSLSSCFSDFVANPATWHWIAWRFGSWYSFDCLGTYLFYLSFPEYDRLKLLLITGKSGTILPRTAIGSARQLCVDGSVIFHR